MIRRGDGGLSADSIALAFQLRALDTSRLSKRLGRVSPATLAALAEAVQNALGIV
jgi:mRNA-degrading endonuclease toxin of MazEF toxin-antitoxin module